eukprot:436565_1
MATLIISLLFLNHVHSGNICDIVSCDPGYECVLENNFAICERIPKPQAMVKSSNLDDISPPEGTSNYNAGVEASNMDVSQCLLQCNDNHNPYCCLSNTYLNRCIADCYGITNIHRDCTKGICPTYISNNPMISGTVRIADYVEENIIVSEDIYSPEEKSSSYFTDKKKDEMTMKDVLTMILLFQRTFDTLNTKIVDSGDDYVVSHDVFCKFIDSKFDPDKREWSECTKAASDLFQSVLDEQQNFITLGQVRSTIDTLMDDIAAMECGELTRIKNHVAAMVKRDQTRCKSRRKIWKEDGKNGQKNPALKFDHLNKETWVKFLGNINKGFKNNISSQTLRNITAQQPNISSKNMDVDNILRAVTTFDIIDEIENNKNQNELQKPWQEVFDTILSFCSAKKK